MCDLHVNTLPTPTATGAIATQIRFATQQLPQADWIKLYNSGNFFDPASIPPPDYRSIAALCQSYDRIIVENHPRFGKQRHHEFQQHLSGKLEIAVGLESVQPRLLHRLGKQMTRDDFDRYARFLAESEIELRVFLIVGAPHLSAAESIRWARLSVRHAVSAGARHVSLIPARAGHGWNGLADTLPVLCIDSLADLFASSLDDLRGHACLGVDLWDIDRDKLTAPDLSRLQQLESAILHQDPALL